MQLETKIACTRRVCLPLYSILGQLRNKSVKARRDGVKGENPRVWVGIVGQFKRGLDAKTGLCSGLNEVNRSV